MALSDKVLQAQSVAKRAQSVPTFTFSTVQDNGFFIQFAGTKLFQFETAQEANLYRDKFNAAFAVTKSDLTAFYEQKVDDIINA